MTRSAGIRGLARLGSAPIAARASRMAARSTTQGTPVKSCSSTRAGMKLISLPLEPSAEGSPAPATYSTSAAETRRPSSNRRRFSSRILVENGRRGILPTPVSSNRLRRKYWYSVLATRSFDAAPKLFFDITLIIVGAPPPSFPAGYKVSGETDDLLDVSSLVAPSGTLAQRVRGELEALVYYFDRDASGNGRLIRELLQADRQSFFAAAIEILRTRDESRGSQYLISVLAADELLLPALCESKLTRKQSLALAQAALQAGVMADVILAKHLTEHAGSIGGSDCPSDIQRLMDLLTEISDGTRIRIFSPKRSS